MLLHRKRDLTRLFFYLFKNKTHTKTIQIIKFLIFIIDKGVKH